MHEMVLFDISTHCKHIKPLSTDGRLTVLNFTIIGVCNASIFLAITDFVVAVADDDDDDDDDDVVGEIMQLTLFIIVSISIYFSTFFCTNSHSF